MEFPLSSRVASRLEYLAEVGSTNDVLVESATGPDAAAWPDLSVVVTDNQTRGRGRLGRTWLAPTGKSLAISVLVRPFGEDGEPLPPDHLGWFPLLAGAAMTKVVREVVEAAAAAQPAEARDEESPRHEVTLKWPNDVLIDGYKVSGILSELLPDARGLVIGAGLNLTLDEHDLPTLTSTSLLLVTHSSPNPDAVLALYLTELQRLARAFIAAGGDPVASGLLDRVTELCGTLGSAVRVELPGGTDLVGTAIGIDTQGRLIVENQVNGELQAVAAGDVTHLRY
jgi:BirA family biotin operon repressor/biotin-[acetyl-CoA-carboxylase] ligase